MYCIKTKYSQYRLTFNTPGTAFTVNIFQYISLELKFWHFIHVKMPCFIEPYGVFFLHQFYAFDSKILQFADRVNIKQEL